MRLHFLFRCNVMLLLAMSFSYTLVFGNGGEEHGAVSTAGAVIGNRIRLTEAAKANIGLALAEAQLRTLEEVIRINGKVTSHPNRVAFVTSRIPGKVVKLQANLGDVVEQGAPLVELESRQIGNPPPVITLNSPIRGHVIDRDVVLGQTIEPDEHLFEVADLSIVIVEADLYEEDVAKVKIDQSARVRLPVAYPQEVLEGKLSFISATLDPLKRTAHVWVTLDNPDGRLKPEMAAEVAVVVKATKEAIAIPREALLSEGGEKYVYLEDGDVFVRQPVALGLQDDRYVEIVDGLFPGDKVVTQGNYELRMVELTSRRPPPATKGSKSKKGH